MAANYVGWQQPTSPNEKKSHGHLSSHQETELQLRLFVQGGANCLVLEPIGYLFLLPEKLAPDGKQDISKIAQMSLQVFQAFFDVDGTSFTMIFHNSLFFFHPWSIFNWLVVWNIWSIFHFIYGMSSFPLTNIFQDG
jgi:hypothetical protein